MHIYARVQGSQGHKLFNDYIDLNHYKDEGDCSTSKNEVKCYRKLFSPLAPM